MRSKRYPDNIPPAPARVQYNGGRVGLPIQPSRVGTDHFTPEPIVQSQGELEARVCEGISRFQQEFMGRGPKEIHAHIVRDLLIIRLKGVLTAAEQKLVQSHPPEKGRDLLKQVRTQLIETARPVLQAMVEEALGIKTLSMHHDISTLINEEIVVFALAKTPSFRPAAKPDRP